MMAWEPRDEAKDTRKNGSADEHREHDTEK